MTVIVFLLCTLFTFQLCRAEKQNYGPTVTPLTRFQTGDYMTSSNSQFHATMQPDGNFVIYHGSLADRADDACWSTKTNGKSNGPFHMDLQQDRALNLYDLHGVPIWSSNTAGKGTGPVKMTLQDDGRLVIIDANGRILWSSGKKLLCKGANVNNAAPEDETGKIGKGKRRRKGKGRNGLAPSQTAPDTDYQLLAAALPPSAPSVPAAGTASNVKTANWPRIAGTGRGRR